MVLDEQSTWVQVFDTSGTFLSKWGGPDVGLYHPRAMALTADGDVAIADTGRGRVVRFNDSGQVIAQHGNLPEQAARGEHLDEPAGIAALSDNGMVVADAKSGALRAYNSGGAVLGSFGLPQTVALDGPRLARAPDSSLYATVPSMCAIVHLNSSGEPLRAFGNCDATDYVEFPSAIAVDTDGRLYVADLNRHLLHVLAHP